MVGNQKIILIGNVEIFPTLFKISQLVIKDKPSMSLGKIFSNDMHKVRENTEYMFSLDLKTINESYKNNAILCVKTFENLSEGILFDDFETKDMFILDYEMYNMVSTWIFNHYNVLTIWCDKKLGDNDQHKEDPNVKYLLERFDLGAKYMYFLNESEKSVASTIIRYLDSNDKEKNLLLVENS